MASETKERESWTELEPSGKNISLMNPLRLSRVFRFIDQQTSAPQISDFPDSNPFGETPLKITDVQMQEKIDSLDFITEALVREINLRSVEKKTGRKTGKSKERAMPNTTDSDDLASAPSREN